MLLSNAPAAEVEGWGVALPVPEASARLRLTKENFGKVSSSVAISRITSASADPAPTCASVGGEISRRFALMVASGESGASERQSKFIFRFQVVQTYQ